MAAPAMDLEDDDLYGDEAEETVATPAQPNHAQDKPESKSQSPANDEDGDVDNDEEAEEEVEEEEDSDIDIITERPDGSKPEPLQPARYTDIHNIPQRSAETGAKDSTPASDRESTPQTQTASSRLPKLGNAAASAVTGIATSSSTTLPVPKADAESKANSTSKLDIDGNPVYSPVGKPIMSVVIDTDLVEHEKPWRQPGTDLSDYFNYGFDEFTWALYAAKQESMRNEFSADTLMANQKRMMEEFNAIMMGQMGGGMPGMPGMDPSMMPPEMQQMMQQMMSGGMPGGMSGGMPGGISGGMPGGMTGGMPNASIGGAGPMQGMDMQTDPSMFGSNSGNNDGGQSNAGPEGFGGQQFAGTQGNNDFNQVFNNQGMQAGRGGFNNRGRGRRHQW